MKNAPALFCLVFFLLFSQYNLAQDHKDCETAAAPCGESPFHFDAIYGIGAMDTGLDTTCLQLEFSSTWIKWTVGQAGVITFVITPEEESQDIDFIVFKFNNGNECSDKEPIRCMASGENVGQPPSTWEACTGPTGLAFGETDVVEYPGCASGDNNFLAPIEASQGDSYVMLVNDFSGLGAGFTLGFGGTAVLECISIPVSTAEREAGDFSLFEITPTLSSGQITMQLSSERHIGAQLTISDMFGRLVYPPSRVWQQSQVIDLAGLPAGLYLAVLEKGGQVEVRKFFVGR